MHIVQAHRCVYLKHLAQAEQRHERSERRATINGNVEFSVLARAVPFIARRILRKSGVERSERTRESKGEICD